MIFGSVPRAALVALAAGAVACVPALGELLELDRSAALAGEVWRLVTGHFVHWNADHAVWDIATFAALGSAAERMAPRRSGLAVVCAIPLVSAAFWWFEPALESYRGLSGLDCALAAFLAAELLRRATDLRSVAIAGAIGLFLVAKIGWELATAGTIFVDSFGAEVVSVPIAHAAGAVAGVVAAFVPLSSRDALACPSSRDGLRSRDRASGCDPFRV